MNQLQNDGLFIYLCLSCRNMQFLLRNFFLPKRDQRIYPSLNPVSCIYSHGFRDPTLTWVLAIAGTDGQKPAR